MTLEINLKGVNAFVSSLTQLDEKMAKRVIPQAQRAALRPLLNAAKAKLPKAGDSTFYTGYDVEENSGKLRDSLGISSWRTKRKGLFIAVVKPRKGFAWVDKFGNRQDPRRYAIPLEYGHVLKFLGRSTGTFIPPLSFMRSSIEETKSQVESLFFDKLRQGIIKYARKKAGV